MKHPRDMTLEELDALPELERFEYEVEHQEDGTRVYRARVKPLKINGNLRDTDPIASTGKDSNYFITWDGEKWCKERT